jgi:hypothetical protein
MSDRTESETPRVAAGMIWIPGGTFRMGSDRHYAEAAPVRTTKPMCRSVLHPGKSARPPGQAGSDPNLPDIKIPRKVIRAAPHYPP